MNRFALIGIEPLKNLSETAEILGQVFGVSFLKDETGHFEEYPAYIATCWGLLYVILGPPDPKYDVRSNPTNEFQLKVEPIEIDHDKGEIDISRGIQEMIAKDGRINCFSLD